MTICLIPLPSLPMALLFYSPLFSLFIRDKRVQGLPRRRIFKVPIPFMEESSRDMRGLKVLDDEFMLTRKGNRSRKLAACQRWRGEDDEYKSRVESWRGKFKDSSLVYPTSEEVLEDEYDPLVICFFFFFFFFFLLFFLHLFIPYLCNIYLFAFAI